MKNSQKGFVVPLLIIIAVLIIGGGIYIYSQKFSSSQSSNPEDQNYSTIPNQNESLAQNNNTADNSALSTQPPIMTSVDGPIALTVGQKGTWNISATNSSLFSVIWADGSPIKISDGSGIPLDSEFKSSPAFTHVFTKSGTYYIQFFAKGTGIGTVSKGINIKVTESYSTPSVVVKSHWGVSFPIPQGWTVTSNTDQEVDLNSGGSGGDSIDIALITGQSITTTDAKFGYRTYYFDTSTSKWMVTGLTDMEAAQGLQQTRPATAEFYLPHNVPVFVGTNRWLTYIIPLSAQSFLRLHITGSGDTQPLRDLVHSLAYAQ